MGKFDNYECDGQMNLFDIKPNYTPPKKQISVKLGENIYFVGYRAWTYEKEIHRDLAVLRCRITEIQGDHFLANFGKYMSVWLSMDDFKKRWFYFREEADKRKQEIMALWDDDIDEAAGAYLTYEDEELMIYDYFRERSKQRKGD